LNPAGHVPVAWLPFAGIAGTVVGSFIWGWLGDRIGRRASILLAGVVFIATSICGSMPDYRWNLFMCFVMGLGVGGMLPITFARPFLGLSAVVALLGLGVGLVTFGFQLWIPSNLQRLGFDEVTSATILRDSALMGFPATFLIAWLYGFWSSKKTVIGVTVLTA